MNMNKLRA